MRCCVVEQRVVEEGGMRMGEEVGVDGGEDFGGARALILNFFTSRKHRVGFANFLEWIFRGFT